MVVLDFYLCIYAYIHGLRFYNRMVHYHHQLVYHYQVFLDEFGSKAGLICRIWRRIWVKGRIISFIKFLLGHCSSQNCRPRRIIWIIEGRTSWTSWNISRRIWGHMQENWGQTQENLAHMEEFQENWGHKQD